jgi:hypothetical protein
MVTRSSLAALLLVGAFALPGQAADNQLLSTGVYDGIWHGDKVKIIVERVAADGCFSGVVHFDRNSAWPGFKFDFSGRVGGRDTLTIQRMDGCNQVAQTYTPVVDRQGWVWQGRVTGEGVPEPMQFEMHVPR